MNKYLLTLIFALCLVAISNAQADYQTMQAIDLYRTTKMASGETINWLTESDINGSPYLNNEFITGTVYTKQKQQYVNVALRYNIYNDKIEFETPEGQVQEIAEPEIIEKVVFGENEFIYIPYSNSKKIRKGYFLVLQDGLSSLLIKKRITFKKAVEPGAYKEAEPPKFINNPDDYYIKVGTQEAKQVGNKKDLIEIFPDNKDKIEVFIKKNKIKTNKPESLKKLVEFYNSL